MTTPRKFGGMIAIVESTSFDFEGPRSDGSFDESKPSGKAFTIFVEQRLVTCGIKTVSKPVSGEEGWTFDIILGGRVYRILVHWAPIGNPQEDRWIIQIDIRRGLFRSLFGKKIEGTDLMSVRDVLHRQLNEATEIDAITWVTNEEFAEMY